MSDTDDRQLLSPAAAARRLGVSERTVHRMLRSGRLMGTRVQVGSRLVLRIPADALLLSGTASDSPDSVSDGESDTGTDGPDLSPTTPDSAMRDALALVREHAERVDALTEQNAALHEKLEQFSGQVGFLQAQVQERDATIKLLQAPPDEPAPRRRWWSFRGRIWRWGR